MRKDSVLVCYGKLNPETIKGYKYLIVESKHYFPSNIRVFKSQNEKVFAYISLGEVNENAPHYDELKKLTLGKNKIWNSHYLDLSKKKTIETLMLIVDEIFEKGYDGLFLDNFDNYTIHGPQKEQKAGIIELMKLIKEKYPKKMFIQNAGLELLPDSNSFVDAVAVESVATDYDFKTKQYKLKKQEAFEKYLGELDKIHQSFKIPVIIIEYADTENLVSEVKDRLVQTKHYYFIGNIDLQTLPKFKK
ncbi:endo alpha-1,4 polygalactosaminidase [Flavobacterium sp. CYK-55]|uniref:endo alpha-1,4 polygalactosaminidase n=1 Tax=Flavobacterium sp. CYK-55 TaxID=2835529 RepID=UPI001BD0B0AE|nr:endo alpha-1,4 polygalactosaminidase [Flavobacterium sp. CYK-55]MBS7786863.1 endo alpha-1,4 polygalactosaminidase [Flavobacterium sp. CYK-55]